ncbi:MAG: S-methyl-5-thioribose-1-phosphate isomerase [candidate division Zixibacteria bacterium]|nr:S-methyl-5-thioribose-1-phosphate isomerase [candidate division Zixibacteria bacterium]
MRLPTLKWTGDALELIDQTLLPGELVIERCEKVEEVHEAIRRLVVRGAPAIGVAAAYGVLLAARAAGNVSPEEVRNHVARAADYLETARPTAVNLSWAVRRMVRAAEEKGPSAQELYGRLAREAEAIADEDRHANRRMGKFGAALLRDGATVLTHCNAGALATVDYGTALGVVYAAAEEGKNISVYVDETRPLLQGARLTAWELMQAGVPATLICDDAAATVMAQGRVDCVLVGADRVAANGDVANKIGTLNLAILARHFLVPFYVAAPLSSVDFDTASGADVPVEERTYEEVTGFGGVRTAPPGVGVSNPAFDVTPARLVDAIITEAGVAKPPLGPALAALKDETDRSAV